MGRYLVYLNQNKINLILYYALMIILISGGVKYNCCWFQQEQSTNGANIIRTLCSDNALTSILGCFFSARGFILFLFSVCSRIKFAT